MSTLGLTEGYINSDAQDWLDQHLDLETAMLRVQLDHNETLKKFMHHTKLVIGQLGMVLDGIPANIVLPDGTVVDLVAKAELDSLKSMAKQLSVFELSDITPELERDIYIYAFAHNFVTAHLGHAAPRQLGALYIQVLSLQSVQIAREMEKLYWENSIGTKAPDLLDEHGYIWKFIDPNNEVQKLTDAENITPVRARAKIMQRSIDALYDDTKFVRRDDNSRYREERWIDVLFGHITNVPMHVEDIYIQGLEKWDPSRFAIKDEESE